MLQNLTQPVTDDRMQDHLDEVTALMEACLTDTTLGFLVHKCKNLLSTGKMLRSRMAFRVGPAQGVGHDSLVHAAAAVELIHSASLLHDDVIDGGMLRRGCPTFWVERGIPGAILLGDLLLFKALDVICRVESGRLTHPLVKMTGQLCEAEAEQDLMMQGMPSELEYCVRIARRKTGALFAFIGTACAGHDLELQPVLAEAGYALGTAYQLADDLLDAYGDPEIAGKTLGTDQARNIISAAALKQEPREFILAMCDKARDSLAPWPRVQAGVDRYMEEDLLPAVYRLIELPAN